MVVVAAVSAIMILISIKAGGGGLEPNAPPGPTMHTLEDIYQAVGSVSVSGSQPPPDPLSYGAFLKIGEIPGESADSKHKDWIEILSYSHNVKPMPLDSFFDVFTVVHTLDKASPKLALYCCKGTHLKEVILQLCDPNRASYNIMQYKLSDVIISGVQIRESPLTRVIRESPTSAIIRESPYECLPMEEVKLNFGKIEWTYTLPDGNTVLTYWDAVTGKGG